MPKEDNGSVYALEKLSGDGDDPMEILKTLEAAINNRKYNQADVTHAMRQVLDNYEAKNRIFLTAASKVSMPRIIKQIQWINRLEEELQKPARIASSSSKDLIRLFALAQSSLMANLDEVKKVADMRLEAMKAAGNADGTDSIFEAGSEMNALADMPGLDPTSRDKVRKLVTGLMECMDAEDELEEVEPTNDE